MGCDIVEYTVYHQRKGGVQKTRGIHMQMLFISTQETLALIKWHQLGDSQFSAELSAST